MSDSDKDMPPKLGAPANFGMGEFPEGMPGNVAVGKMEAVSDDGEGEGEGGPLGAPGNFGMGEFPEGMPGYVAVGGAMPEGAPGNFGMGEFPEGMPGNVAMGGAMQVPEGMPEMPGGVAMGAMPVAMSIEPP